MSAVVEDGAVPEPMHCDVLVIGGGPAGSTIATLLAEYGWRVTLVEKQRHPRFHIGESLLPMNMPIFERLGVLDEVTRLGVPKYGAQFNSVSDPECSQTYYFSDATSVSQAFALEVRRAEFDDLLLKNSVKKGVEVHEGVRVCELHLDAGQAARIDTVEASRRPRTWMARYVVDASGRDTVLARKFDLKRANRKHASAALFAHFKNVPRLPGKDAGNISIHWFAHGWLWLIPLPEGITSVGAVCSPAYLKSRTSKREDFLWETIERCPTLYQRMQHAELVGAAGAAGNYSYVCTRPYGANWLLVGDAFAIDDPVFSTGVFLAMDSASRGADVVDAVLKGDRSAKARLKAYETRLRGALKTINWLIYRFSTPGLYALFMAPTKRLGLQGAVVSVLAGDLFEKSKIKLSLMLFKMLYHVAQAGHYLRGNSGG